MKLIIVLVNTGRLLLDYYYFPKSLPYMSYVSYFSKSWNFVFGTCLMLMQELSVT